MKSRKVAFWGILGACAIAVSFLESLLSPAGVFPGAKLGLSNVVTMIACSVASLSGAVYITLLKSLFALVTRGATAFLMSFAGGMLASIAMMIFIKKKVSLLSSSIVCALLHNSGQLAVACLLSGTTVYMYYFPVLIVFACISGAVTGTVLKAVLTKFSYQGESKMSAKIISPVKRGRGGIHVPYHKHTMHLPCKRMPDPEQVVIPMAQNIGAPCEPCVNVGDHVKIGQIIGDSEAFVSCPVHASVSGDVTAVGPVRLANGKTSVAVTIASDGKRELFEGITPPKIESREDFLKAVRASGAVGLGGAGFPTHVKLSPPKDKKIDTVIINAAECEPYITVDYRETLDNSWDVLSGVDILREYINPDRVIIAIEDNKPEALKVLSSIADKSNVSIMRLKSKYPQGAEKMMILSATGRRVPEGGLPSDVGCIVINVATVAFIARYVKTGKPLTSRSLTVDGTAIANPSNVRVPIGTSLKDIVDFCGGFTEEPKKIIFGGPMMGSAIYDLSAPLCKANNSLLAFKETRIKEETACINCGKCLMVCPMGLMPTTIMKATKRKDVASLKKLGSMNCMECGCCAYICPAGQPLVQYQRLAKQLIKEEKK